jgi:sortase A
MNVSGRGAMRRMLRFIGDVVMVGGVLLLVDAGVTLAWQEPVSALFAQRDQARLESRFEDALAAGGPRASEPMLDGKRLARVAGLHRARLEPGDPVARIELPTIDRRYVVVEGTDTANLRKGPGHYPETSLPGEGATTAIAGHRTTYLAPFRPIDELRPSDPIVLTLPYGRFTYRVERTRIVKPDDIWVTRPVGYDRLVLTACHPLYSAARRIVVFARLGEAASPTALSSRLSKKASSPSTSATARAITTSQ